MFRVLVKQGRGLLMVVALAAIAVAACSSGGPTATGNNNATGNGGTNQPGGTGGSLASGLSANLNSLDSYQFSWSFVAQGSSATDSGGTATISGTVVNKPAKAIEVNDFGIMFIQVGDQAWMSTDDGTTWMVDTSYSPGDTTISDMLPTEDYASWFDSNATNFTVVGNETKNNVECIHYTGDSSLAAGFAALGVAADFHADLWIAKSGNYPVSGTYGMTASDSSESGSWGYTFDITHINDAANKVEPPTNVATFGL
jgi:hypothetical protein